MSKYKTGFRGKKLNNEQILKCIHNRSFTYAQQITWNPRAPAEPPPKIDIHSFIAGELCKTRFCRLFLSALFATSAYKWVLFHCFI